MKCCPTGNQSTCPNRACAFVVMRGITPKWQSDTFWPVCREHVSYWDDLVARRMVSIENINDLRGYLKEEQE